MRKNKILKLFGAFEITIKLLILYVIVDFINNLIFKPEQPISFLFFSIWSSILVFSIFYILFKLSPKQLPRFLQTNAKNRIIKGVIIGIGAAAIYLLLYYVFISTSFSFDFRLPNLINCLMLSVALGIMGGVREELFFRGYLYEALQEKVSRQTTILLTSSVFALIHIVGAENIREGAFMFLFIFLLGINFALIRELYTSIWSAIGMHFSWNFILSGYFINYEAVNDSPNQRAILTLHTDLPSPLPIDIFYTDQIILLFTEIMVATYLIYMLKQKDKSELGAEKTLIAQ